MASRRPARWLGPLALLVTIGAVLLVISSAPTGGSKTSTDGISSSSETSTAVSTTGTTPTTTGETPRFYVVKPGDVLSAIADATGVPLSVIEQLNPKVDAQTLHAGQKIKLVP